MAKNEKKVSINTMEDTMKERFPTSTTEEWYGIEVRIKPTISFSEMLAFVESCVNSSFQGSYVPEVTEFAIRSNLISRYTNISLPDNLERRYELLYRTDIVSFVERYVDADQIGDIITAIQDKVCYLCDCGVSATQQKLDALAQSFDALQKKMSGVFENISAEDMSSLLSAVENGGVDEEKLAKAYLEHMEQTHKQEADA